MYGIIGENSRGAETLPVLVRRLLNNRWLPIERQDYPGCGEMLRKGAGQLRDFAARGCKRFIVCCDSDGANAEERRQEVVRKIISPSALDPATCLVLVPVQEIEAWILADIQAVTNIISSWTPATIRNPEGIANPKEYLRRLSRDSKQRPRYDYTIHNLQVAKYLDLDLVHRKCCSFCPLRGFLIGHRRIKLPTYS